MYLKKRMSFVLAFLLLFGQCHVVGFSAQTMTIDMARNLAEENSNGVQDVIVDKIKKEIELQQAKEGIRDIRKKESTVRFSLLFNIKMPEKHGLPKEIELIMKVPEIKNDIAVLEQQEVYEMLKSQQEAEQAFYDVLQAEERIRFLEERIADSKEVCEKIKTQFKIGKGKKDDVEYMEKQVLDYEGEYQKALLEQDKTRKALGDVIGQDVRMGYTFEEYFPQVNISRSQLEEMIAYAKEHDFELYKTIQARKLAEIDTNEILGIYKSKYSKYIGNIESYIKSHEGKKMDYEEFIAQYNETLTQIDSPWDGAYVINLIFFKIKIPKEWFKGEYSGTRYMEDQKYALFVSLVERDKARQKEEQAIKTLENNIYMEYSNLKQIESAYENAVSSLALAKSSYEEKLKMNQRGLVEFTSLESSRNDYYTQQNNLFEMKMEYAKTLSAFNLSTSGYINHLLGMDTLETGDLEAGNSVQGKAEWRLDTSLTAQAFSFTVTLPEEYSVDQYQLYYEGQSIGEKTNIEDALVHLPFTYEDTTRLEIRFYQEEELVYIGEFDGGQYEGEIILKEAVAEETVESEAEDVLGTWQRESKDTLRKGLFITVKKDIEYENYEIFYEGKSIGKAKKGEELVTLGLYLSDMQQIVIWFYDDSGAVVAKGVIDDGFDTGNIILQKG